jgi:hypothetical protein
MLKQLITNKVLKRFNDKSKHISEYKTTKI